MSIIICFKKDYLLKEKSSSGNYFWWIKVPQVDLIHQSRRLHISIPRPDLIHH